MEDALAPPVPLGPLAAGAATPTTLFLTRRRSHLDSGSYRTLFRLFSHCLHLHPQKHAIPAHPEVDPAAANPIGDKSPQEGSVPPKDAECERGKGVAEEPAAVITSVSETPAPSVVEAATGNPIADLDAAPQGSAEHELAGVERVEAVEDMVVVGSACRKTGAVVEELGGQAELVGADDVLRTMKACLEGEVEESVEVEVVNDEHLLLDRMMTNFSGLIGDASGSTTSRQACGFSEGEPQNDGNISEGVPKSGDGVEENRLMGCLGHQSVDGDVFEEGEIEGDLQDLGDESDGSERQDADDEKLEEDSVTKGPGENESSVHDMRCLNFLSTPEIKETGDLILNKEGDIKNDALIRVQTVSYEEIVEWNETPVPDAETSRCGNRKRHLTEERKAKKTKNKRVKRAQQRVADGVKRLKLAPIIKPKVVQYCHFYLHGKCQQGNACKFSHDTTPLTKSKPCTHFARASCLKGDDCPYDHELSKYPCHNFVENGTCFRGDKCKFSHVIPTADGTSKPDAKESDSSLVSEKPISRDQTSSQKALAVHDGGLLTSAPTKHKSILKTLAGISVNAQKASARMPKGVQFRPPTKARSDSSMLHQDALPTEKHMYANGGKYKNFGGPQATEGDKNANPNRQRSVPLFDEKNSLKEASSLPKKSLPADTTAVLGSVSTQHEVSEASRILQEFLFGAGS